MRLHLLSVLLLLAAGTQAQPVLFQFRDVDGVVHLANHRLDDRYQPLLLSSSRTAQPHADPDTVTRPARVSALTPLVEAAAAEHGLDAKLLHAIIEVESGYDPTAVSPKGAIGLMQIMPATGMRFGASDLYDPGQNLTAGARYLKTLLTRFGGDLSLSIAAYNAGEGAVARYRNTVPPFAETRDYVTKVMARYSGTRRAGSVPDNNRRVLIISGDQAVHTEIW
jgi:soluble lytic murein transglycosylase-like protein